MSYLKLSVFKMHIIHYIAHFIETVLYRRKVNII